MLIPRVLPCLLLQGEGLVKGIHFKDFRYIGDPINAVRLFSKHEVDEIIFLDISATKENRILDPNIVSEIADESFMPFTIGGGIRSVDDIRTLVNAGAEKVAINTSAVENPELIKEAAGIFGTQSIVVSIDVKKNWLGKYNVYTNCGTKKTDLEPVAFAKQMQEYGAGEILVNSIDKDGTMSGYDINITRQISDAVNIPVIACGGGGKVEDFKEVVIEGGASAAAAGSYFVFHGKKRGVLISFPEKEELEVVYKL